jgi:hypothetical protein
LGLADLHLIRDLIKFSNMQLNPISHPNDACQADTTDEQVRSDSTDTISIVPFADAGEPSSLCLVEIEMELMQVSGVELSRHQFMAQGILRLHWKPTVEETDAKGSVEPKKIPSLVSFLRHVT